MIVPIFQSHSWWFYSFSAIFNFLVWWFYTCYSLIRDDLTSVSASSLIILPVFVCHLLLFYTFFSLISDWFYLFFNLTTDFTHFAGIFHLHTFHVFPGDSTHFSTSSVMTLPIFQPGLWWFFKFFSFGMLVGKKLPLFQRGGKSTETISTEHFCTYTHSKKLAHVKEARSS